MALFRHLNDKSKNIGILSDSFVFFFRPVSSYSKQKLILSKSRLKFKTLREITEINKKDKFCQQLSLHRSSHRRCSVKKSVIRNFAKFTRKHLCQSIFFNIVAGLRPATVLKERLWHRCFPMSFAKFLRTPFLQNTSGRLLPFA